MLERTGAKGIDAGLWHMLLGKLVEEGAVSDHVVAAVFCNLVSLSELPLRVLVRQSKPLIRAIDAHRFIRVEPMKPKH